MSENESKLQVNFALNIPRNEGILAESLNIAIEADNDAIKSSPRHIIFNAEISPFVDPASEKVDY